MAKKFKVLFYDHPAVEDGLDALEKLNETLNDYANDGWELVSVVPVKGYKTSWLRHYFRRPLDGDR